MGSNKREDSWASIDAEFYGFVNEVIGNNFGDGSYQNFLKI